MEESEGEDSGVISPVEPAVAGVSGVVVGGAAVAEEENCDSNSNAEKNNPWPHIQPYFRFSKSSDKKIIYLCELCPGNKQVSAHKSSLTNLKAHMSSKHKDKHDEFLQLVTRKSKRGLHTKRRMNSESEASASLSREPGKEKTKVRPDCSFAPTQLALCLRLACLRLLRRELATRETLDDSTPQWRISELRVWCLMNPLLCSRHHRQVTLAVKT